MARRGGTERLNRKLPFHPDEVRAKIRAHKLVQRLQAHIFGKVELTVSQVSGINVLLRKVLPDLTSTAVTADINVRYVAHLPELISREAWLQKYGGDYLDPVKTIEGTTNGSGTKLQ